MTISLNKGSIMMWTMQLLIMLMSILMSVAFITLLERAYMGMSQRRRGPNKISIWGLLQPVLDGLKLLFKSLNKPFYLNSTLFSIIPSINLIVFLLFWTGLPYLFKLYDFGLSSLFVVILLGMMSFGLLLSGWASNSKYALFGSLRSMVQTISYEISLSLILLMILNIKDSLSLEILWKGFNMFEMMFSLFILSPTIIMILAECGRTPFDLLEAESELVSGFNVEYGSVEFAFLFMAEYGMVVVLSMMFSIILMPLLSALASISMMTVVLFSRYTLPRIRYDYLMGLMWKSLLPVTIMLWVLTFNFKVT